MKKIWKEILEENEIPETNWWQDMLIIIATGCLYGFVMYFAIF